jgi:NADH-quinone oxidoreductase subunit J
VSVPFYLTALLAVFSTVMVITRTNAMHALLYLITSLLSVAAIFYMLRAPFVAALEAIIYAGAIMVLFVFVVMLVPAGREEAERERNWLTPGMFVGPSVISLILVAELGYVLYGRGPTSAESLTMVGPKQVGLALFGPHLLGAELAAFLLLSAMVGAFHLARRRRRGG